MSQFTQCQLISNNSLQLRWTTHAGPAQLYNQQSTQTMPVTRHVYKIKYRNSGGLLYSGPGYFLPNKQTLLNVEENHITKLVQSPLQRQIIRITITNTISKREVKKTFHIYDIFLLFVRCLRIATIMFYAVGFQLFIYD